MDYCVGIPRAETVSTFIETIAAIGDEQQCVIQAVDPRYCAGPTHLETAFAYAERAEDRGELIADTLAMEVLLYAAGTRQIEEALTIGPDSVDEPVLVGWNGSEKAAVREQIEAELTETTDQWQPDAARIQSWFAITDVERNATAASLEALVVERVVLLAIEK